MTLSELYQEIIEDHKVDSKEVDQLKALLYEDGKIDKEEADILFKINNACSGNENSPEWDDFFVNAICDFLLKDEETPGVVDEIEADWLINSIGSDGKVDGLEKQLLIELSSRAKSMAENLKLFISENE